MGLRNRSVGGAVVAVVALSALLGACSGSAPHPTPTTADAAPPTPPAPAPSASPTPTPSLKPSSKPSSKPKPKPTPAPSPTKHSADPLAGWTLEQKVGQLVMAGLPVAGNRQVTAALISQRHLGGVFLKGRTEAGVQRVRNLVDAYRNISHDPVRLLVSTDQEGGQVQVLRGPGFSDIPAATDQVHLPDLAGSARTWGQELAAAGVDVDLAPVADLVPPELADANAPIGHFQRNYGFGVTQVRAGATAFATGLEAAGVIPTVKHFPGLGEVTGNTDTTAGVTDTSTSASSPSVGLFSDVVGAASAARGPLPWVMVGTAVYQKIDPSLPAAFSPAVVGLLRDQVGFDGVVITDDVSAAKQVQAWSPGDRAVRAVDAGCDIVLASADPGAANAMLDALLAKAQADPAFAAKVDAAARRVVAAKS